MRLGQPQIFADGSFQLFAAYSDGWPLTSGDLDRFTAEVSSNLVDWTALDTGLTESNGSLILMDMAVTNGPSRFYRVVETPL